jgi:hypothetical protein
MATDLEHQILEALQAMDAEDLPVTVGDLARRCRADAQMIVRTARHLIDTGRAEPAIVVVYGVPTMYGLMPQRPAYHVGRRSE